MNSKERAREIFRQRGIVRTRDALELGIHPVTLYRMRDEGELQQLERGVYKLADSPELTDPDLVAAAVRAPDAVVCLISALSLHDLTTEVPHAIHLAVRRGGTRPVFTEFPVRLYTFHQKAFQAGVIERDLQGTAIRLYNPEKALVDVFHYRNRLGMDVFLEALSLYRRRPDASPQRVLAYAHVWQATRTLQPYLEQAFA